MWLAGRLCNPAPTLSSEHEQYSGWIRSRSASGAYGMVSTRRRMVAGRVQRVRRGQRSGRSHSALTPDAWRRRLAPVIQRARVEPDGDPADRASHRRATIPPHTRMPQRPGRPPAFESSTPARSWRLRSAPPSSPSSAPRSSRSKRRAPASRTETASRCRCRLEAGRGLRDEVADTGSR